MSLTESLSIQATNFVAKHKNLSDKEFELVKYGTEIFLMNIYKTLCILFIAWAIGILPHIVLFMLSYGLVRSFAFGVHAKNSITCLVWTSIIFLGLTYITPHIQLNGYFIYFVFAFNIVSAMLYAPADTEKRPIINPHKRLAFKIKSLISLVLLFLIAIFYCNSTCKNIIIFSTFTACVIINPITYKIAGQRYNNYKYYVKKEA